ncbi:unnamed protein product [Paramecium sonneborni]|uniref:Uncharacterized protein n=1 Tax=Paramecium sonneborni TaxID=65129 RepID=A0A8S1RPJ0_9CILI|nr:unnamed protein product [Paramecium sonneborni]
MPELRITFEINQQHRILNKNNLVQLRFVLVKLLFEYLSQIFRIQQKNIKRIRKVPIYDSLIMKIIPIEWVRFIKIILYQGY